MEIILIQDVANLGYKNDIVKVRDGYGRNYLLPNKLAIIANESNRKQLAENLKQQAHKLAKLLADAQALAEKLAAIVITVADRIRLANLPDREQVTSASAAVPQE